MKGRRHTPEQIVRKLREADRLVAAGASAAEVGKALEVSEATVARWRSQYGGMKAEDAKELRRLRDENGRLKRMVADLTLDIEMLKFGVSQRRACRAVGQHRTTQRWAIPVATGEEERLRQELRRLAAAQPRWGYKRIWGRLRLDGWPVNRKRIQRLWRAEGLRVPPSPPKRSRLGTSSSGADRLAAQHPNHVWAMDFLFDTTSDGRPFKVLSMCDEFTRESVGGKVARSITADAVADILDLVTVQRGAPKYIRCDNGPEFIAAAIRDWCRFSGTGAAYIDPGSPWQNPYVESFNSRARDELFAREIFHSIMEARILYEDWRHDYNTYRPHSALKWLPPAQYASQWSPATIQ